MDDKNLELGSNNASNTYRATANLNTALENPQLNIMGATGVNIYNSNNMVNNNMDFNNSYTNDNNGVNNYQELSNSNFYQVGEQATSVFIPEDIKTISNNNLVSQTDIQGVGSEENTYVDNSFSNVDNTKVNYKPTMKQKKKPGSGLEFAKELKMMIIIIGILVLFILFLPYIYDFFKELDLIITS